jgi:hypothetical protein
MCQLQQQRTTPQQIGSKRSVSIVLEKNLIHSIPNKDDIDKEQVWYQPEDYVTIADTYMLLLKLLGSGDDLPDSHSDRGLEDHATVMRSLSLQMAAAKAVLDEQDRQWENDEEDEEAIARVYTETSIKAADIAVARAFEDETVIDPSKQDSKRPGMNMTSYSTRSVPMQIKPTRSMAA